MELIQWKPFNDLDRLVQDFPGPLRKFGTDLSVDLYEEGGNLVAKMNLPGVEATDLEIIVDGDSLTISGDRFEEEETDEKDYYSKEIRRGSFSRMVPLPKSVNADGTEAAYKDGVLTVTMPVEKDQEEKGVKVPVKKT